MSAHKPYEDDLDDELDDLDDYLDEFQEEILNQPYTPPVQPTTGKEPSDPQTSNTEIPEDEEQLQKQLKDMMEAMEKEQPGTANQLQTLLDEVGKMDGLSKDTSSSTSANSANGKPKDFKSTIADTLNRVKQSGGKVDQEIKDENVDTNKLMQDLLSKLSLEDGGDEGDMDFSSLLTDMLDQLVSKQILYEPLKDMDTKYPQWLQENKSSVPAEDYERYSKQAKIIHGIVLKFEEESYREDSKPHKDFISHKLEEMEAEGEPPKELAGELSKTGLPGFQFGSDSVDSSAFNPNELPEGFDKELEENCKQQ